jgi:hypothetical protein
MYRACPFTAGLGYGHPMKVRHILQRRVTNRNLWKHTLLLLLRAKDRSYDIRKQPAWSGEAIAPLFAIQWPRLVLKFWLSTV